MNPFIELTSNHGNAPIMININHIVLYTPHAMDNGNIGCYIVLANGTSTRYVQESYRHIHKLIQEFYSTPQND